MRWVVRLLGLGSLLFVAGVIRAAMSEPETFPMAFGVVMAITGLVLAGPALLVLGWRAVFGAAKVGAREAGRVGRELGNAYRDGRDS